MPVTGVADMPSGRKNRGSRHRSHKQHQKQKLDEPADDQVEANLRHGPLPDSDSSSWMMEPLPPHVEGPSVLKQDAENVDSLPRGINRKSHQEPQKGLPSVTSVQLPSKRKKAAVPVFVDAEVATTTPSSLDRWEGGDSRADETLSLFDSVRGESQLHDFKSSNLDKLGNGFGRKEFKDEGDGKMRKGKGRASGESGNRAVAVTDTQASVQGETSLVDTNIRIKNKVSHRRGFPEMVENEVDKSTPEGDSNPLELSKVQNPGSLAIENAKANSRKVGSAKRWDKAVRKEFDVEAHVSHSLDAETTLTDLERKRGKPSDPGANSSPKARRMEDPLKSRRSEGSQKAQKSADVPKDLSRDDAQALDEPQNVPSDAGRGNTGTEWVLQNDHRNLELEKELENRIRRRREESGEKDVWRDDDKEREVKRSHYQKEERYKEESRRRDEKSKDEKHREEKLKDDGGKADKDRSESRHKDENQKDSRYVEDKYKEEKQKADKDREERRKDDKEHDEKRKSDRDREERSIDRKHREDRQKEEKDAGHKEDKSRDSRYKVDKEDRHKDDKDREERFKDGRLKSEENSERHKEEKDWGDRFQGEKEKRVRQREKDDRMKDKDKDERVEKYKEEKTKDDRDRLDRQREESEKDASRDKGKFEKKRSEKEQDDGIRIEKLQGERLKLEKQQGWRNLDGSEKDDREGDIIQSQVRGKEEKLQDHKDRDNRHIDDFDKLDRHEKLIDAVDKYQKAKDKEAKDKDKPDRRRDFKDESHGDESFWDERNKEDKYAEVRRNDLREKNDRHKDGHRSDERGQQADDRKLDEKTKEDVQSAVHLTPLERIDVRSKDSKQNDARIKDSRYHDMDRDYSSSHDETFRQSKDLGDQVQSKSTREQETRDRKGFGKNEGERRSIKMSRVDTHDQERAFHANSGVMDASKSEHRFKRSRDSGMVDSVLGERDHARSRGRLADADNDFPREDRVFHRSREERASSYDTLARSPSPSLPDGSHPPSYDKSARRSKFETSISVSSSSGTRRQRDRNRHVTDHTDRMKQHYGLEEEVKSWEPRVSDDGRGRSFSPEKNRDSLPSLAPVNSMTSVQDEHSRGPLRGAGLYDENVVLEREHRRFSQGGGPSKTRRLDEASRERGEWLHHGLQMNRPPIGGPMVRSHLGTLPNRMSGPSGLLPPPPPFRPGIDNPAVLGTSGNKFEESHVSRESGRYDRKPAGHFKRSEIPGPGDSWRGVGMGNWNAQNQGPGPGPANMFSPFPQIGTHPSGFLGMGQQFPVPPLFGPGAARPSADMGFGGARFHMGDGGVRFPSHGPSHGPVMGWHRPAEPDESCCPPLPGLLNTWDAQGPYIEERQRFGRPEWDQGGQGMTGQGWERVSDLWQGQAGDASAGLNPPHLQREALYQGSLGEEVSTFHQDPYNNDEKGQLVEDHPLEVPDAIDSLKNRDAVTSAVPLTKLSNKQARDRMKQLLLNVDVSAKLASSELYKQYLSMLPPEEAKLREAPVPNESEFSGSMEEDFEFELDSEAQDLLSTADSHTELLPPLPGSIYKEALQIYHRSLPESRVQKSVFGSFLLPICTSSIKVPDLEGGLMNVEVDKYSLGDQSFSPSQIVVGKDPCAIDKYSARGLSISNIDSLYDRVEAEETEQEQDIQVAVEHLDRQDVDIDLSGNQCRDIAVVSDSMKETESVTEVFEDDGMASCVKEATHKKSPLFINCNMQSELMVVEASSVLGDENPQIVDVNITSSRALGVEPNGDTHDAIGATIDMDWTRRSRSWSVNGNPAERPEDLQRIEGENLEGRLLKDDIVGSPIHAFPSDCRADESEIYIDTAREIGINDVKVKSRPQQSSEMACENTH